MAFIKNRALWNAASELTELVQRLGAALTPELRDEHKFAIEVASAIERGYLNGPGTPAVMRMLGAAYTELSVADWERCEELRKANDALKARRAAAATPEIAESLDEVLADRPPRYRVGVELEVRHETWEEALPAEVVSSAWRDESELRGWVYVIKTATGTYSIRDEDTDWDVEFKN